MRNDNNIAYVSPDQKNRNDEDALQLNSIERDVLLPDSIEPAISTDISDIDDNFFEMSNNSLNEHADKNFNKSVAAWAIKYGITHSALIELLKILNIFTNTTFPKDPRTLLQTPRNTDVIKMGDGQYCHFDIESIIKKNDNRHKKKWYEYCHIRFVNKY